MDAAARRTLTIASLATLATFLDTTILYVAFPDITATFTRTSATELSWVLNAYTIVFAALLIPAGKLADRVGHRRVFLAGSAAFTVASMACGLAPTAGVLIVFRIVQAAGAAALIPSSLALVMHAFPRDQIPRRSGHLGRGRRSRRRTGPTLGAAIVEGLGWRWAFFLNLPIGVFTVVAGARTLRESSDPATRVPSIVGVALVAGSPPGCCRTGSWSRDRFGWLSGRTVRVVGGRARRARRVRRPPAPDAGAGPRPRPVPPPQLHVGEPGHAGVRRRLLGHVLRFDPVPDRGVALVDPGGRLRRRPRPCARRLRRPARRHARRSDRPATDPRRRWHPLRRSAASTARCQLGSEVDYLRDYLPSMLLTGLGVGCLLPAAVERGRPGAAANRIGIGGAALQAIRQFGGTFGVALTIAFLGAPASISPTPSPASTASGGSSSPAA